MTAAAARPTMSKAAAFADAAEALGWTVEREKLADGGRLVIATRGDEEYQITWHRNSRNTLTLASGDYYAPGADEPVEVTSVTLALRDMAKVRSTNGALLPFDIATSSDVEVLTACAGRRIKWRSNLSGLLEDGTLPRGGIHYKITRTVDGGRVLHFADQLVTGFRSVRLDAIVEVS